MVQNKSLVFSEVPDGLPEAGRHLQTYSTDFDLEVAPLSGGFTCQVLYASLDPYLRHRMVAPERARDGFEPMAVGSVVPNGLLGKVLKSDTAGFQADDIVIGMAPIQEYLSIPESLVAQFAKLENPHNLDLKLFLGPLGMPGLTAFSALYEIGKPKKGETIFISAASGAVGQMVGQLARREGLRVIGSVGSEEKLKLLTEVFGFDGGFIHSTGDILGNIKRLAPDGIDIYYDNVGGEQLEAAITAMNDWGRIVACGYASQYSLPPESQYGIQNTGQIIGKRITWRGMSVFDESLGGAYRQTHLESVGEWLSDGSLKAVISETVGIDNASQGLVELLQGKNIGKALVKIAA
ncbi:unnamed protein product [Clonostachys byssicola]|uniref:Dehydrogenase FUB6 n=1 Tax=Clonostachys byssicola TaxID=160290 RepID=A0A9N9U263_9HYPO|nr:unnamed protein product [Clonostachys byssicola]